MKEYQPNDYFGFYKFIEKMNHTEFLNEIWIIINSNNWMNIDVIWNFLMYSLSNYHKIKLSFLRDFSKINVGGFFSFCIYIQFFINLNFIYL